MGNLRKCAWCGREYGDGYNYDMCSKKCQHEYYKTYPHQWGIDTARAEKIEKQRKGCNRIIWYIVGIILFWLFLNILDYHQII